MSKRTFIIVSAFVFLAIFGYGIWWYFFRTPVSQQVIPEWYKTDKDGDGILDSQEQEMGTNPEETDTDGDSVPDRLEIEVYKTDPKNSDTDGDGFLDGLELLEGHSPLEKPVTNQ